MFLGYEWYGLSDLSGVKMYMYTYSGRKLSLIDPQPEDIDITDISLHLSKICRFNGAVHPFYSVAQHSVFVSDRVDAHIKLAALLHDAGKAYYGDISTPLKMAMQELVGSRWDVILSRIDSAITAKFNLKFQGHPDIKVADHVALATEIRDLTSWDTDNLIIQLPYPHPMTLRPTGPLTAGRDFFKTYWRLK